MNNADRERTVLSIRYFAEHTSNCIGRKLFKLLYIVDSLHFQQTGQPITGLEYIARRTVPLPHELKYELEAPKGDLLELVTIHTFQEDSSPRHLFASNPQSKFDATAFTKRQLQILDNIATQFRDADTQAISPEDFDNGAWRSTAINRLINPLDSIRGDRPDYADLMAAAEHYQCRKAAQHYFR